MWHLAPSTYCHLPVELGEALLTYYGFPSHPRNEEFNLNLPSLTQHPQTSQPSTPPQRTCQNYGTPHTTSLDSQVKSKQNTKVYRLVNGMLNCAEQEYFEILDETAVHIENRCLWLSCFPTQSGDLYYTSTHSLIKYSNISEFSQRRMLWYIITKPQPRNSNWRQFGAGTFN